MSLINALLQTGQYDLSVHTYMKFLDFCVSL